MDDDYWKKRRKYWREEARKRREEQKRKRDQEQKKRWEREEKRRREEKEARYKCTRELVRRHSTRDYVYCKKHGAHVKPLHYRRHYVWPMSPSQQIHWQQKQQQERWERERKEREKMQKEKTYAMTSSPTTSTSSSVPSHKSIWSPKTFLYISTSITIIVVIIWVVTMYLF